MAPKLVALHILTRKLEDLTRSTGEVHRSTEAHASVLREVGRESDPDAQMSGVQIVRRPLVKLER